MKVQPDEVQKTKAGWHACVTLARCLATIGTPLSQARAKLDDYKEVAEAQKPFIETAETGRDDLGRMTAERWDTLGRQLKDLGDIPQAPPASECFRAK